VNTTLNSISKFEVVDKILNHKIDEIIKSVDL